MRLTAIKLAGFKSFVDPTVIKFPSNLMGVVGPNGCGKSNIIDAVRWVMGESSARQLRGESMTDVIFTGSSSRKPVGTATVELIFDNSDGRAGGEYAQYNEISVKRQVSRDGQSGYFLNGTRCRRKDITDLFLGTGLGPRSYAIIEQGMISQIVEARPEELRGFLEEAAGISRYKERRRETENRIRHTRENLERLNDLREEVGKHLDRLNRQARAAERYRKLKRRYREDEARLLALRWRTLKTRGAADEQRLKETENRLQAAVARQRAAENALESLRASQHAARDETQKIQAELYEVAGQIARLEQSIEHQRELRERQRTEYAETEARLNELKQHMQLDKAQVEDITGRLARLEPALAEATSAEQQALAELEQAEARVRDWQERWQTHQNDAGAAGREADLLRVRIEHLDERMAQAARRLEALSAEVGSSALETLDREIEEARDAHHQADQLLVAARAQAETARAELRAARESLEQERTHLDGLRKQIREKTGRLEALRVLNQPADQGGALAEWCKRNGLQDSGRLLEALDVDADWMGAAEAVLGAWLQALPVDSVDPDWLEQPPAADLLLVEAGDTPAPAPGRLAQKVRGAGRLTGWLNTIHTAPDRAAAHALAADLAPHESVVTPAGEWLGPGWVRLTGRSDARAGILEREREIKQLEKEVKADSFRITECEQGLEVARDDILTRENRVQDSEREVHELQRRQAEAHGVLTSHQRRRESLEQRRADAEREQSELQTRMTEDTEAVTTGRRELEIVLARLAEHSARRQPLLDERDTLTAAHDSQRQTVRAAREQRERVALDLKGQQTNLESLRQSITRSDDQVGRLQTRFVELSEALARGEEPEQAQQRQLNVLLEARVEVEQRLSKARGRLEEMENTWREHETERHTAVEEVEAIRQEQSSGQLLLKEIELKAAALAERVTELEQDLDTLIGEVPEQADEAEWQTALEKLDERIRRMEPVNLAAIEEFEQESERKAYLDAQNQDLTDALETLEQAIARIDRTTRTRFKETFERVNKGMETLYPRLFGGGHAYLELVGDDLLTAGVAIMARPPGKRVARIHLMSGGEKALTAVAFVFSIFNLNPAPFCLLDEVDAPLDDANVGRFSTMVREMSERVQFVMVTHNKVTMEVAHQLVGVTMREAGVSRLVSVDLDKAVAMASA